MPQLYLIFSDAAKFADIARNIYQGRSWGALFNFFDYTLLHLNPEIFPAKFTSPIMPYVISIFFRLFGVSDLSVIATSFFFFILLIVFTYLLGRRLFGKFVGLLSSMLVVSNLDFWNYAKSGASETLFMFEIVLIPYLILLKKKWSDLLAIFFLVLMYFTRPQAFIFIAGYIIFYLLLRFSVKKTIILFFILLLLGIVFDSLVLTRLNGQSFLYSSSSRGIRAIVQHSQNVSASDVVRGLGQQQASLITIAKKTGTNLFNFYRLLPNILSPYIFMLFAFSLFIKDKRIKVRAFKIASAFCVVFSFLLPTITIPFFRYIHPTIPLIYLLGSFGILFIAKKIVGKKYSKIFSLAVIAIFAIVLNVGITIHDYRYYQAKKNYDKPPAYVTLSKIMRDNTKEDSFIITNLDTWGSWYGERKTMWFPINPGKLVPPEGKETSIDAIYLTSYLMDDQNYYMGQRWRKIFDNPKNIEMEFIGNNFEFYEEFTISAHETLENEEMRAVLFKKIKN